MDSQQVLQLPQRPQLPQCKICSTSQKLLRCAKCKAIYYCSATHQHLDWPRHKQECRALAKQRQSNNRLQQLTSSCSSININGPTSSSNFASNTSTNCSSYNNLQHVQLQQKLKTPQHLDDTIFILGTHENEILNSKAETVTQNSNNCEYLSNIEANSTTTDQMHNIMEQYNSGSAYGLNDINATNSDNTNNQNNTTQLDNNVLNQPIQNLGLLAEVIQPQSSGSGSTCVSSPVITKQQKSTSQHQPSQQQQQVYLPSKQTAVQPPIPQLSNHLINQHEKSSSYQIGTAVVDENIFENANERRYEELCRNIINDMNEYGLSVVDDFLGCEKGLQILKEVHKMHSAGMFKDGQLVNNMKSEQDLRTIRGDKITWVKGVEPGCSHVGYLINQVDAVICRANCMLNNGKLGNYVIKERTKAMVACYPGSGSHYVMHVDNPNKDGRVITAIYYLNPDWDSKNNGGVLRIFPEQTKSVADIEPKFDRLIFFWSDKRNPHEVQPAHRTRYAITVWYFDADEREQALNRCKSLQNSNNASNSSSNSLSHTKQTASNKTNKSLTNSASSDACANSPASLASVSQTSLANNTQVSPTSSSLTLANDSLQNHLAATTNSKQNFSKPIQVVKPNSYK